MEGEEGSVPVPDPTKLTTEAVDRATATIHEWVEARLAIIAGRVETNTKTIEQFREERLADTSLLARELSHERELSASVHSGLKELMIEKFAALATLTDKLSLANATALTAALSAAEKAVGEQNRSSSLAITKSEQGMQEALKQLQTTFQTEIKGITALMATMQSRLDRGEGVDRQQRDQVVISRDATSASQGSNSNIIASISVGIAVLTIIVSIVIFVVSHQQSAVQPTVQYVPAPTTAPSAPAPITVPR